MRIYVEHSEVLYYYILSEVLFSYYYIMLLPIPLHFSVVIEIYGISMESAIQVPGVQYTLG